jgi:hypothetical protein
MDQQINRETATREEQQKITRADKHGKTEEDSAFFDFQDGLGFDFLSEIPSSYQLLQKLCCGNTSCCRNFEIPSSYQSEIVGKLKEGQLDIVLQQANQVAVQLKNAPEIDQLKRAHEHCTMIRYAKK